MTTRLYYHLTHDDDSKMIARTQNRYDQMNEERKAYIRKFIVQTPGTCGGKTRLDKHRLWIELLISDFLCGDKENKCYAVEDYDELDVEDVCIVWFFEIWIKSEFYNLMDYD